MNASAQTLPATREQHSLKEVAIADHGLGAHLVPQSMADVVRFAETMARGAIAIRKHLRDNPGACLAVTLQALDWGMNPISVANKSYAVNDQLAYESQLIAAVIHARAPIKGRPRYTYDGAPGTTRRCTVEVTTKDGEVLDYTSPEVGKITTKNSPLWKSDEDQQLGYFSIRSLARRHFPELLLGVYDREEAEAMRDVTPRETGLRGRLNGPRTGEGFTAANVADEPVNFAEQAEEVAEAEFTPAGDEPAAEEASADPPADDQPTTVDLADGDFDAIAWAGEFSRSLDTLKTVQVVADAWDEAKASGKVFKLKAANPGMAEELVKAVNDRIAEIKGPK